MQRDRARDQRQFEIAFPIWTHHQARLNVYPVFLATSTMRSSTRRFTAFESGEGAYRWWRIWRTGGGPRRSSGTRGVSGEDITIYEADEQMWRWVLSRRERGEHRRSAYASMLPYPDNCHVLVTYGRRASSWRTAVNVKLLLPPRQSRGTSLWVLDNVKLGVGQSYKGAPCSWRNYNTLRLKTYVGAYGCSRDASLCSTVARPLQSTANYFDTVGDGSQGDLDNDRRLCASFAIIDRDVSFAVTDRSSAG
jgi:hypothetical protein